MTAHSPSQVISLLRLQTQATEKWIESNICFTINYSFKERSYIVWESAPENLFMIY